MQRFKALLALFILPVAILAQSWSPDILGEGFEMRYVEHSSDYSKTHIRSTIIRHLADKATEDAILYIHGFNDYFFQREMAERFASDGYDFYAVDLRKYGRSLTAGQKRCQVRELDEYFADIDSAIATIKVCGHNHVILIGHSTGGLIASYYMVKHSHPSVTALVLNSPFLDWNLGKMEHFVNLVSATGHIFPRIKISQGASTAYAESLLKEYHGEWTFNTEWKTMQSPDVDAGWVRAINKAQHYLRKHKYAISVPTLLLYSSESIDVSSWTPEANRADVVLDVSDIVKYGALLGRNITYYQVTNGMHDLILSAPNVRYPLYDYIMCWLASPDM